MLHRSKIRLSDKIVEAFNGWLMSKNSEKVFYAVGRGREIGIYESWKECKAQTEGIENAKYRKFYSYKDAEEFVNFWKNYSTPVKKSLSSEDTMQSQRNVDSICEDEENFDKVQPFGIQVAAEHRPTSSETLSSHVFHLSSQPSPPKLSYTEGRAEQKNADILALNLRLDSFEKRFDTCLKEIGAIAAEISHIKSDIKDLKETPRSTPKKTSVLSTGKVKDGRLQTVLHFGSNCTKNTSVRSYSSGGSAPDSEEFEIKEGRTLKRKLSGTNIPEKSKRFADVDDTDDLNKVKIETVDYSSFTIDEDDYVAVYTDGSALSNGKGDAKAGIGIWFGDDHPLNVAEPVAGPPTNNTAEIQAARVAIERAIKAGITKLKIHTDSEFLINCATKWIHRWKTNGWTLRDGGPVKNKIELEKLDKAASKISVRWEKVAAHSKIRGNETADRLANEGAAKYER